MLKKLKLYWKKFSYKILLPFLITRIGQNLMRMLLWTCKWEIEGLDQFKQIAKNEKCILILWHNRLAMVPFILYKYAPQFIYAAFVSNSRDGELISSVVHSYKAGRTIRVPHNNRHQALKEMIKRINEQKEIVIITPDGPRGPCYEVKPGAPLAALETSAYVVPLTWSADRLLELKTWDKLRIPKPFSTIKVTFKEPIIFRKDCNIFLEEAQKILQNALDN